MPHNWSDRAAERFARRKGFILHRIFPTEDVNPNLQGRARRSSAALAGVLDGFTQTAGFDLEKRPLSVEHAPLLDGLHRLAAPFAVRRLMGILVQLMTLLEEACDRAQRMNQQIQGAGPAVPFMAEFLDFVTDEKRVVLRKKRWP